MKQKETEENKKEEKGRSMIEMLGVLAIAGVITMAGIAGYSKAMETYKFNKQVDQISRAASEIRGFYAASGEDGYEGLNADLLISLVPEMGTTNSSVTYIDSTSTVLNSYGGALSVRPINTRDVSNERVTNGGFAIGIAGLSKPACIKLAAHNWKDAKVEGVSINRAAVYSDFSTTSGQWLTVPADPTRVKNWCSKASNNQVYFAFK